MPTILNFFGNKEEIIDNFCKYFRLKKVDLLNYIEEAGCDNIIAGDIIEHFELDLNNYDSSQIEIVGKHMTTSNDDDINSYKENGLMDLKNMLQKDTILSKYLSSHSIIVDVDRKEIRIGAHEYDISPTSDGCSECINGRDEVCSRYEKCNLRKAIGNLSSKLYYYNATIEFFINEESDRIRNYSCISRCPEILDTLENIKNKVVTSRNSNLMYDWMDKNTKLYIIEFSMPLSLMESYNPMCYDQSYMYIEDTLDLAGYTYSDYMERTIPKNVFDNYYLFQLFFSVVFHDSTQLGSLIADVCVPADKIIIYEIER